MSYKYIKPDPAIENDLWEDYFSHRSTEVRNKLFLLYEPLLGYQVMMASKKLPAQINYEEIYSAACDGLINAIELFNPLKKALFSTYCPQRISGAIYDWVRDMDRQSRIVRIFEKKRSKAEQDIQLMGDSHPSDYEVSKNMGISMKRFDHLASLSAVGDEVNFSAMDKESEKDNRSLRATQIADTSDPTERIDKEFMVDSLLKGMGQQERIVIILYHCEEMTLREIGWVLNLSESRCSQINSTVLARIKERLTGSGKEFVELFNSGVRSKNGRKHLRYASFV